MDYKSEVKKIGWNKKEVANRVESLIEKEIIDTKDELTDNVSTVIEKEDDNHILNEFLNKKQSEGNRLLKIYHSTYGKMGQFLLSKFSI